MTREQIEEAALQHTMNETGLDYIGEVSCENGFIAGAHWRINSVWHDTSEEPDVDKPVLVNYDGSRYMVNYFMTKKLYRSFRRRWTINRWAYVDDLLPERKEEAK